MLFDRACDDDHCCGYGASFCYYYVAFLVSSLFGFHAQADHFLLGKCGEDGALRYDFTELYLIYSNVIRSNVDQSEVDFLSEGGVIFIIDVAFLVKYFQAVLFAFEKDGCCAFCVDGLDDRRVAIFQLAHIGGCGLDIFLDF